MHIGFPEREMFSEVMGYPVNSPKLKDHQSTSLYVNYYGINIKTSMDSSTHQSLKYSFHFPTMRNEYLSWRRFNKVIVFF